MLLTAHVQLSVFFVLPETKGVSLERMEKIFGGIDHVEAGEREGDSEKREALAMVKEEGKTATVHVEDASKGHAVPERSQA